MTNKRDQGPRFINLYGAEFVGAAAEVIWEIWTGLPNTPGVVGTATYLLFIGIAGMIAGAIMYIPVVLWRKVIGTDSKHEEQQD